METIYNILEYILPFSWMSYDFMKNAFLAILIITPMFGILGTMIVNNKMAFFSDALGHSALTGMAAGIILGVADTSLSMAAFGILFALLLNWMKRRGSASTDTIISVFASLSTALGLVILSRGGNFSKYSGLLVGDILSITRAEILRLLFILAAVLIFWCCCFNRLHAVSVNASMARSRGIRVAWVENTFAVLVALIVMSSIQWTGILIINALLILPAASARNIAGDMREYHLFSVLISLFSGISGLIVSYYINVASGPMIVVVAALVFFATLIVKPHFK